jgi:hypothetical protein
MNDTGPHLGKLKQNQEISEFKILAVFVNRINNLAIQSWKKILAFAS